MLYFVNDEHERNFVELIKKDKTFKEDCYRLSFFYLLSTDVTFNYINRIYDFEEATIIDVDITDKDVFSSSERKLIRLAINLFSNYRYADNESIVDIFSSFDDERHMTALYAIDMRMRFHAFKNAMEEFYKKHELTHTPVRYY